MDGSRAISPAGARVCVGDGENSLTSESGAGGSANGHERMLCPGLLHREHLFLLDRLFREGMLKINSEYNLVDKTRLNLI